MGDQTSYERHQRHRAKMLELCHETIGMKVEVDFTPLGSGGRSKGLHSATGIVMGVGIAATLRANNILVLLMDEPDEEGRRLLMINARQINHIRRKTFTAVDVEDLIASLTFEESAEQPG